MITVSAAEIAPHMGSAKFLSTILKLILKELARRKERCADLFKEDSKLRVKCLLAGFLSETISIVNGLRESYRSAHPSKCSGLFEQHARPLLQLLCRDERGRSAHGGKKEKCNKKSENNFEIIDRNRSVLRPSSRNALRPGRGRNGSTEPGCDRIIRRAWGPARRPMSSVASAPQLYYVTLGEPVPRPAMLN